MASRDQAAYAWDEGAAFHIGNIDPVIGDGYTGSVPGNLYSPYEFNWKRDADFPDSTISTQQASVGALNYGLINLRGTYNAAAVESAQLAMYKIYSIAAIRSALKYSNKARDSNGDLVEKYLAEGWAYWRSASGTLGAKAASNCPTRRTGLIIERYMSTINKTAVEEASEPQLICTPFLPIA
eukprot:Skav215543  [mRNA]  locus=scaffold4176:61190:63425:- [translate_table: standard]